MNTCFWLCTSISLGLLYFMVQGKPKERNFWIVLNQYSRKRVVKELFEDQTCKLTQFRNRSYMDCNLILQRNVDRVEIETQLDMLRPNHQMIRLYNIRLDACELFALVHNNPFVNIVAKSFMKVIDKKLQCPLISHFNYSFTNWHLKETDLPNNLPECQFKAFSKFYADNKLALTSTILGKVIRKN